MQSNRSSLLIAALTVAAISLGSRSNAQVIVQTFTVPTGTAVPIAQSFTFNKFNTMLGGLNSITLALNGSLLANITVTNTNDSSNGYNSLISTVHEAVVGPGSQIEAFALSTTPLSGTAGSGLTLLAGNTASHTGVDNIPLADFSFYSALGGGSGTLSGAANTLSFTGNATGSNPGNVTFGGNATGGEIITLTYNYTPNVPEPGVATFFIASALGGLGTFVRRRKK